MQGTTRRRASALAARLGLTLGLGLGPGGAAGDAHAREFGAPHGRRGQGFVARVEALGDMRYRIAVRRGLHGATLQTIDVRNGVDLTRPGTLRFVGQGARSELWVCGGRSDAGLWYKVWRFDPATSQFVWWRTTVPGS